MNNKILITKTKVINFGKNNIKKSQNGIIKDNYNSKKEVIESYNTINNDIQYKLKKNILFEKKNNLSTLYFLSANSIHEDKKAHETIKTTKETDNNKLNLKYNIIKNRKKLFLNSNIINNYNNQQKRIISNSSQNNLFLNKELDKFRNKIDNLIKYIEDFEETYINSKENTKIKEEFNNNNKNIKSHQKHIIYRESNKNQLNKDNIKNKTMIIKTYKLKLMGNNYIKNNFSSTKNIKNKYNNSSIILNNKNFKTYNNELNKNIYNRKINYSSLIDVKKMNKQKDKKEEIENNIYKNVINQKKQISHYYPSKLTHINFNENNNNDKMNMKKEIINNKINNKIYIKPSFNKTPKINRIKESIKKTDILHSNKSNNNKTKKIVKK